MGLPGEEPSDEHSVLSGAFPLVSRGMIRKHARMDSLSRFAPIVLSILRIVVGLLLLEHGSQKLFNFPPGGHGTVMVASMIGVAGIIEFSGGLLLVLGLLTRLAAFFCSGLMAVAYFMAHAPNSLHPIVNKGELAVIYCFVCLFLFFAGGGAWSIDALLRGNRASTN